MKSQLGWTLLSREALKRAEAQLAQEVQGVRDEIGFLGIHQAYADRFFPGTSVLHTRLRYVLFVPWLYERIQLSGDIQRVQRRLKSEELSLTGRLKLTGEDGIIGGRKYPKPSVQPPSMVYWAALSTWGILRPMANGEFPGRSLINRVMAQHRKGVRLHDDEHQLLDEEDAFFVVLPKPPPEWNNASAALDFNLRKSESKFLKKCLLSVRRPGMGGELSLIAQLVDRNVRLHPSVTLWDRRVVRAADIADRLALMRAKQAAALSAIGRAVYAALVEKLLAEHDKVSISNEHRHHLKETIRSYREDALQLDVDQMIEDAPWGLNFDIIEITRETQFWLRHARPKVGDLYELYSQKERRRKGIRARLPMTLSAKEKRADWAADPSPLAKPLHYRWNNVSRLLRDLGNSN